MMSYSKLIALISLTLININSSLARNIQSNITKLIYSNWTVYNSTELSSYNGSSNATGTKVNIDVPFYTIVISLIMYSLIFLIGFFGNALVIIVAFFNQAHQHSTHYCLVNLSIADLLLIIVCMPSAILDLFSQEIWYLGKFFCKFIPWLEHTIAYASILTIVAISVERSLAIAAPLKAKRIFTNKRLWVSVIIIWIVSTVASIPIIISTKYVSTYHKKQGKIVNICFISTRESWQLGYLFVTLIVFYLLPCVLLFVLYGRIVCVIRNRNFKNALRKPSETFRSTHSNHKENEVEYSRSNSKALGYEIENMESLLKHKENVLLNKLSSSSERLNSSLDAKKQSMTLFLNRANSRKQFPQINQNHVIVLLIVMMLLILLSLLPYRVFSIWVAMATKEDLNNLGIIIYFNLIIFCRVTFYINSALNPIFYHIISTKFQDSFKKFFKFSNPNSSASIISRSSRINLNNNPSRFSSFRQPSVKQPANRNL